MGRRKKDFPDFSDSPPHLSNRLCDKEGCCKAGEYRAPKDRSLKEYYWFCLEHVREYNAAWDYYKGMSVEEIERALEADVTGNRPTWRLGERGGYFSLFDDPLSVLRDAEKESQNPRPPKDDAVKHSGALLWAAEVLEVSFPLKYKEVRAGYKKMAKKWHPDSNGGTKEAEEKFKDVAEAYRILMTVLKSI